jgi:uncharacterized membrane protein
MPLKINPFRYSKGETHQRSVIKALTWRVLATLDTTIISYFLTGNIVIAISIGVFETIAKIFIYFIHERAWNYVKWGKRVFDLDKTKTEDTKKRSISKAVTWSILGAFITIAIAYILTVPIKTAISIGIIEIFTRLIIYFLHERVWNKVIWGKEKKNKKGNEKN